MVKSAKSNFCWHNSLSPLDYRRVTMKTVMTSQLWLESWEAIVTGMVEGRTEDCRWSDASIMSCNRHRFSNPRWISWRNRYTWRSLVGLSIPNSTPPSIVVMCDINTWQSDEMAQLNICCLHLLVFHFGSLFLAWRASQLGWAWMPKPSTAFI